MFQKKISVKQVVSYFLMIYLGIMMVSILAELYTDWPIPKSMSVYALILAVIFSADNFVKKMRRVFAIDEYIKVVSGCMAVDILARAYFSHKFIGLSMEILPGFLSKTLLYGALIALFYSTFFMKVFLNYHQKKRSE